LCKLLTENSGRNTRDIKAIMIMGLSNSRFSVNPIEDDCARDKSQKSDSLHRRGRGSSSGSMHLCHEKW